MFIRPDDGLRLARLLSFLGDGEVLARDVSRDQAMLAPSRRAGSFLRAQTRQETRHARLFEAAARSLAPGRLGPVPGLRHMARFRADLERCIERRLFARSLLALQVVLEGVGETVLNAVDAGIQRRGGGLARVRRTVLREERAHHGFGVSMLGRVRCAEELRAMVEDDRTQRWLWTCEAMLSEVADLFDYFAEDPADYLSRVRSTLGALGLGRSPGPAAQRRYVSALRSRLDPGPAVISVIIPALNEARALPATLAVLGQQTGPLPGRRFDVTVVDGGSEDGTRDIVRSSPGVRLLSAPRGRASQMNTGAAAAEGDRLLFLHADTLLPADALERVAAIDKTVEWGGFRHRFSGSGPSLRLISALDNLRCRCTGIVYGDQAMFVRRDVFQALGGFPPLAMLEDIRLSERLAARSRPLILPSTVITDSRKFVKMGVWRSLGRVALILLCVQLRRPIPETALAFFDDVR